jgi:tellurium resistance protein TerZ
MIISFDTPPIIHDLGNNGTLEEKLNLDINVCVYNEDNKLIDLVYYGHKYSKDRSIRMVDDSTVSVDLSNLLLDASNIVFIINSYSGKKFDKLPAIYIYLNNDVFAIYEGSDEFINKSAILIGTLCKLDNDWKFVQNSKLFENSDIHEISKFLVK